MINLSSRDMTQRLHQMRLMVFLSVFALTGYAETPSNEQDPEPEQEQISSVPDEQVSLSVEALKKQVIKLNRDLFILEEDLLFPANTQIVVYLSLSTGQFIDLDSVTLKLNDEVVASHLYTERQLNALQRGGMQRIYMGNLKTGEHEITAVLHGLGPKQESYKLAVSTQFQKDTEISALEIRIEDQSASYQPKISIQEWEQ
ncbi:MAG: AraC family transcriptional regulator [Oleiphilus sp.]